MQYYIQSDVIKEVQHAKYLGVIIDHRLSWNEHINYVTSKANNVKCFLQSMPHSYQKQLLLELITSYPGICFQCVGCSYTKEYINN